MKLRDLVDAKEFDPDHSGMDPRDMKPWSGKRPTGERLENLRYRTRCLVAGCGIPYSAGRVCGYCRGLVKKLRKNARSKR